MPSILRKSCEKSVRIKYVLQTYHLNLAKRGKMLRHLFYYFFFLAFWAVKLITETSKENFCTFTQQKLRGEYLKI